MPGRGRVGRQHLDLTGVPPQDAVVVVERLQAWKARLERRKLGLVLIPDQHRRALVLVVQVFDRVQLVRRHPDRLSVGVVDKPSSKLLQLACDRCGVGGDDLGVGVDQRHLALHRAIVIHRHGQLDRHRVKRRQTIAVLARLKHIRPRADALHDRFQRIRQRHVVAKVTVDAVKVLLQKCALAAPQHSLVNDLALTEHVLEAVGCKATRQPPPDLHRVDDGRERLEALAAGVLQPRQFIKHHGVEVQLLLGQPLQVVVVGDHHLRVAVQRRQAPRRRADCDRDLKLRCPLRRFRRPDRLRDPQRRKHQKARGVAVGQHGLHGRQRDRGLACADWRKHHRAVVAVQEVSGFVLIRSKVHFQLPVHAGPSPRQPRHASHTARS